MPVVRPRTISLPPEEMVKLGREMVTWAVNTPDALHLNEFYTAIKGYTFAEFKNLRVCQEFYPYYEHAKNVIAKKYIDGTVNSSIAQRWQRVYFPDLKEEEDETADATEARKARSLMSEAKILEEERLKVLAAVQRGKKEIK